MSPQPEIWLSLNDLMKLVVNEDRGKWSRLSHGTTVLLHSRGVQRYTDAFDHAMLESQLGYIVCTLYLLTKCARSLLTSIPFGIVQSFFAVQTRMFSTLPGMASSHTAESSLASSNL